MQLAPRPSGKGPDNNAFSLKLTPSARQKNGGPTIGALSHRTMTPPLQCKIAAPGVAAKPEKALILFRNQSVKRCSAILDSAEPNQYGPRASG
jgi:hypothetical protein